MGPSATLLARLVFQDQLGAQVSAAAAGVLAAVLVWHFVSMARQGRWAHWTCWSAGGLAAITLLWLIALLTSNEFDSVWTKLALLGLLAVATVVIFYHAVYSYLGPARVSILLALRCLSIAVLVLLLFKPALGRRGGSADRPTLVVLLDRSQSMNEADCPGAPGGRQRFAAAVDALLAQQTKTESYFDVKYFVFDQTAVPVERAAKLAAEKPVGPATDIDAALNAVAPVLADERAEGAILISDGIHNGPASAAAAAEGLPRPLYTVGVGGPVPEGAGGRDLAVGRVTAPDQAFSNNVATIGLDVQSSGYAGQTAAAVLKQVGGAELARVDVKLADGIVPAKLEFVPKQTGVMELEVELAPLPGEALSGNNRHQFALRVGQPQIKVLYVEGSIRSEYRFLTQELGGDPHVELMSLIQVRRLGAGGAEGAEFQVHGHVGGKTLAGMPVTAEQFKMFDVIVIGDLDRTYLSAGQMTLIQQAVRDGKGFLMIGGQHSFGPGGYGGTPIEQLLPVELGPRTIGQETMPFQLQLTTAGRVHPILAGLVDFISPPPDGPASQLPELTGCVKVLRAKPAGQVLAVHPKRQTPDGDQPLPVLTVQQYGAGRVAAFTADTTWRWKMFRTVAAYEGVYPRFWGQLVRWLASSELVDRKGESGAILNLPRSYFAPGEPLPLTVRMWDKEGAPADSSRVTVKATGPGGRAEEIVLDAVADRPGVYSGQYSPRQSGTFQLALSASKSGNLLGSGQRQVEVGQPGAEAARRSANIELLQALASRKATRLASPYVPLAQYDQLIDQLTAPYRQQRLAPEPERTWPRYTTGVYGLAMVLFVGLLSFEWLLRRQWQLQ